jgi:hypothetical protein
MKRFCPFDGDELVPLTFPLGGASRPPAPGAGSGAIAGMSGIGGVGSVGSVGVELMGKICPHCSRRYESDATFCGRDGSALVSVN